MAESLRARDTPETSLAAREARKSMISARSMSSRLWIVRLDAIAKRRNWRTSAE